MDKQTYQECQVIIAVADACWRSTEPSHSFHVLEWLCWKQRCRLPLVLNCDKILSDTVPI